MLSYPVSNPGYMARDADALLQNGATAPGVYSILMETHESCLLDSMLCCTALA